MRLDEEKVDEEVEKEAEETEKEKEKRARCVELLLGANAAVNQADS